MKKTSLKYLKRKNFGAEKTWRNWRKMAKSAKLNPRQIENKSGCAKLNPHQFFENCRVPNRIYTNLSPL